MSTRPDPAASRSGTILFVDDEPLSLKYFKASVGKYANVLTACSAEAAMEILASEGDQISVVVSDERMPRDSGVAFLSSVRKSWPSAVRVLTSAYHNVDLQQAINGAAIHRFLPKPWNLDELCSAMQEALRVERKDAKVPETFHSRRNRGNVADAVSEVLAMLAREFSGPLSCLGEEAQKLSVLSGARSVAAMQIQNLQMASWSAQLRQGQIAAVATQVLHNVEQCKSIAASISGLAEELSGASLSERSSMAEVASEVLERLHHPNRTPLTLDARRDFQFLATRRVIMFVLSSLLQSTLERAEDGSSKIAVELIPGADCNEVRISTSQLSGDAQPSEGDRISRCVLWAFGGEMVHARDEGCGTETMVMRLPKADGPHVAAASH
jgi:two-component system probable response regulator PhcQ